LNHNPYKNAGTVFHGRKWSLHLFSETKYSHKTYAALSRRQIMLYLIDWGKYYEKDGKTLMPVSIQAHHSFVDGLHIGQFVDVLQKYLDKI